MTEDRHVRRSGDDYTAAFLNLLPQGIAWPRESSSVLVKAVRGLSQVWGLNGALKNGNFVGGVDARAADLLEIESDPRLTTDHTVSGGDRDGLLPEWERAWGLPDPCFQTPQSQAERQRFLVFWMTLLGAQSEAWFYQIAEMIGVGIRISEHAPFMVGISRCGDTPDEDGKPRWEIGPPEIRFYWEVAIVEPRLIWFRVSEHQCGVDPHVRIAVEGDLECLIDRWKPAHTEAIFDYGEFAKDEILSGGTLISGFAMVAGEGSVYGAIPISGAGALLAPTPAVSGAGSVLS